MDRDLLAHHLDDPSRRGPAAPGDFSGAAGGAPCGDLIRVSVAIDGGRIARVRFAAEGCATARAAGAALAELAEGAAVLDAARIGPAEVCDALGGLGPQGRHAADLAADALHRALAAAAAQRMPLAPAPPDGERVLVALSGGVDSAVAALLERRRGADVVAVTLKLWADRRTDASRSCCSPQAVLAARELAHGLGLPHLTLDLEPDFRERVVGAFIDGHRRGRTPNPCVICNGDLRIDAMLDLAARIGASALVTGHYARIADDGEGPLLAVAADPAKDQTYMLSGLSPEALSRIRFPLAELEKARVREIATAAGLAVAAKRESQDLCFLAGEGKRSFLERHGGLAERPGAVVDRAGRRLGEHRGHHGFTVGQRRGIGVAAQQPLYVLATDAGSNTVTVGPREALARNRVPVREATLHRCGERVDRVVLRYHSRPLACRAPGVAAGRHRALDLSLDEPAHGFAPGQTACLMAGELVVGTATIA